ncbi:MAG: tRNA pseudouridine(55) synthase TruB [Oscillospiraceae bacterium]|nr:tRNA pseudouridine(55) synthase TruB [Oscillospiraceae bacterium]
MNGVLVVDKPRDHTSHDVVARLRGMLRQRRIGHGGTLDPMATGVLPALVGRATRASEYLLGDKEYLAELTFGLSTDTHDITGLVTETRTARPTREETLAALAEFTGPQEQIPPMVSAVKIGGAKLYELHRRGLEVERPARPIQVYALTLEAFSGDGCTLRAKVSKGTYIRVLAHDLGRRLGCLAALSALTRTAADPFTLAQAHPLDDIAQAAREGRVEDWILPVDSLFAAHPALTVNARTEAMCRNGAPFPAPETLPPDAPCRVYAPDGTFLLLGRTQARDGRLYVYTEKSFFEPQ